MKNTTTRKAHLLVALALSVAKCALAAQDVAGDCSGTPLYVPENGKIDVNQCTQTEAVRASAGVVSTRTLSHKPPKAARKEFERAVRASEKGHADDAIQGLLKAIRLDPGFAEAEIELGAVYVKTSRAEQALEWFDRALILEPNSALIYSNKATALVLLNRAEEAELTARRAVQLEPKSIEANFMLGSAMLLQDKITPETAVHLSIAAEKYPRARDFLARVQQALAEQVGR